MSMEIEKMKNSAFREALEWVMKCDLPAENVRYINQYENHTGVDYRTRYAAEFMRAKQAKRIGVWKVTLK